MRFLPALLAFAFAAVAQDAPPSSPSSSSDTSLPPLKDLDGYFPWTPSASPEAWAKRAEQVRMQMRVSLGIWPEPTRTPLNAVVHGRIERDDYAVEKVYFEAMPGFFVTGSLFRPKTITGKVPAVLCPHGHWDEARFALRGDAEMKKEIASGGERFANGNRSIFQSLGVQLARMGCVAFVVDMIGYCDSQQISYALAHKFAKQRPEMISPEPGQWGLFSPQAESHAQSIMGLQTWTNMRALDFLTSLPEVDATRLACTGASGGGTQTMILGALDPRLAVAVPCVMVSTAMQGGCTCENASGLRVDTGNVEFAALFAPKPMGLTSAKDWTVELPTKGFPDLQKHWAMMGAPSAIQLWAHPEFGHNYNIVTREHIYGFFNEHLKLSLPAERLKERDFDPLTKDQLTVWDAQHPQPPSGPEFEKTLLKWWSEDAKQQMEKDMPTFRKIAGAGFASLLASPSQAKAAGNKGVKRAVLVLGQKQDLSRLAGKDMLVSEVSLLEQGHDTPTRKVKNPREAAAFTFGYNRPLFAERVQAVTDELAKLRAKEKPAHVGIVALDAASAAVATAASLAGGVDALVLDTQGFRFQKVSDIRDPMFFPAGAKYGDLPGLLALAAPRKLFLMGEGAHQPDIVTAGYETAGAPDTLRVSEKRDLEAAMKWLDEALK